MAYHTKRFDRNARSISSPPSRAPRPVRYFYTDANRTEIESVTVRVEAGGEDSYETLMRAVGMLREAEAELLYKARRFQPWHTPRNGDHYDEDDHLDSEEVGERPATPEFSLPPPRR